MKKFISGIKAHIGDKDAPGVHGDVHIQQQFNQSNEQPFDIHPLGDEDYYRYRYHHGANLGSVFVLEKWLTGGMFPQDSESSELGAVSASVKESGPQATRAKFEKHWHEYINDSDIDFLSKHANAVRLPIGYWTLGPDFCRGTPFEPYAEVYTTAWSAVESLVHRLGARNIGVLVDLHGLPGGANGADHSGTNSGRAELWSSSKDRTKALDCYKFLAPRLTQPNIIGLQLCNETDSSPQLWSFYDKAIAAISPVSNALPLYLSDAWNLSGSLSEVARRNVPTSSTNPLILDTHLYYCFSSDDTNASPEDLISKASNGLSEIDQDSYTTAIVGEYSCVLSEPTWSRAAADDRASLIHRFGQTQTSVHRERSAGAFFWTAKMDWMPGGEWGFVAQTEAGNISMPEYMALSRAEVESRLQNADNGREGARHDAVAAHEGYWSSRPGEYNHALFAWGWDTGFSDARGIFSHRNTHGREGADKLGSVGIWALKRMRDARLGHSAHGWEFAHGLRQGVAGFHTLAGL